MGRCWNCYFYSCSANQPVRAAKELMMYGIGYNFLTQEDNPFPTVAEPHAPNVVCCYAYPGAAYANVGDLKEWHVDFLNSQGDVMVCCQNIMNGARNYTIHFPCGKAKTE